MKPATTEFARNNAHIKVELIKFYRESKNRTDMKTWEDYESEFFERHDIVTDPKQGKLRIDKFLNDRLSRVSRNRIQEAIRAGSITVDDKVVKPNYKIRPNETISVLLPKPPEEGVGVKPEPIPIDVVYEDDDVLVINKQAGLVVHPGIGNHSGTLVNGLVYYFEQQQKHLEKPLLEGNPENRPYLVHRIDKDTTGLMVIGKNDFTIAHLGQQFFKHDIHRRYRAIVWGQPEPEAGTIELNVGRDPRIRNRQTVFPEGDEGKWAKTHYKTIEGLYYISLVECELETGRTHQIRIHMKSQGHPLFNDEKYTGDRIHKGTIYSKYRSFVENCFKLCPRQALHAAELGFVHPRTGESMLFKSALPEDMESVLARWRIYIASRKS